MPYFCPCFYYAVKDNQLKINANIFLQKDEACCCCIKGLCFSSKKRIDFLEKEIHFFGDFKETFNSILCLKYCLVFG